MFEESDRRVRDVMSSPVVTVRPHSALRQVVVLLARHRVSGLPVTSEAGELLGMITSHDLFRWRDEDPRRQAWWNDILADGHALGAEVLDDIDASRSSVETVMSTRPIAIAPDATLGEAARLIAEAHVSSLPVTADGRLVGIVSRSDLVRASSPASPRNGIGTMGLHTIIVPVQLDDLVEHRLDAILPTAALSGAHLEVLLLTTDPVTVLAGSMSGVTPSAALIHELRTELDHTSRALGERVAAWRERHAPGGARGGVTVRFVHRIGQPERDLARAGRLADLLVFQRPEGRAASGGLLDAALFETGRPVLILPPPRAVPVPRPLPGRVAIAWNGSLEAARAVMAAMGLLEAATSWTLLTLAAEEEPGGRELEEALRRRGLSPELIGAERLENETTGAALLRLAHRHGADLLVMGAYTHSRLRQFMLGGATRHMLAHATLPVLMAH